MADTSDNTKTTNGEITAEEKAMLEQLGAAASQETAGQKAPDDQQQQPPVEVNPVDLPPLDAGTAVPSQQMDAEKELNLKMLLDIPVDIHVEIGNTRASIRDILRLGVSSVIELDRMAGQSADIIVNGKIIGQGDIVVVNETFGVRITKLVGVEERLQSMK
jgi:flagellar motor switch protein FliN/FliY